jgi:hypothetical protein
VDCVILQEKQVRQEISPTRSHYILQLYTTHLAMSHIAGRKGLARFQPSAHRATFSAQLVGADIAATRKAEFHIRERVLAYHRRAEADPAVSA